MAAAVEIPEDGCYSKQEQSKEPSRSNYSIYMSQVTKRPLLSKDQEKELAIGIQSARQDVDDRIFGTQFGRGILRGVEAEVAAGNMRVYHVLVAYGLTNDEGREEVRDREYECFMQAIRNGRSVGHVRSKLESTLLSESLRSMFCERMTEALVRYATLCEMRCATTPVRLRQERRYLEDLLGVHKKHAREEQESFRRLVKRYNDGKEKLISSNLRFVVSIAMGYRRPGISVDDLIQDGNLGLMRAVERFDIQRGYKFSTNAGPWIRQAITRSIADKGYTIRIPVHMQEEIRKVDNAERAAMARGEDKGYISPDIDAEEVKNLRKVKSICSTVSLNEPTFAKNSDTGRELIGLLADESIPSPEEEAIGGEVGDKVSAALDILDDPRDARILRMRFENDMTLKEIGDEEGVSRERIRQIEAKTIKRLKEFKRYGLGGLG